MRVSSAARTGSRRSRSSGANVASARPSSGRPGPRSRPSCLSRFACPCASPRETSSQHVTRAGRLFPVRRRLPAVKAIRVSAPGGPEALRLEDIAAPSPKEGEALVRVEAIGLNFIDVYFRLGLYKPAGYPFTPGGEAAEVAGVVESVGPGVTGLKPGDRVATVNAQGAYAEKTLVAASRLVPIPEGVSARQAAAVMLQGMTAHYLATSTYSLKKGDTCLVHAASGGVGLLLCRIAKRRGARVIGTVSTEAKAALARQAGADE